MIIGAWSVKHESCFLARVQSSPSLSNSETQDLCKQLLQRMRKDWKFDKIIPDFPRFQTNLENRDTRRGCETPVRLECREGRVVDWRKSRKRKVTPAPGCYHSSGHFQKGQTCGWRCPSLPQAVTGTLSWVPASVTAELIIPLEGGAWLKALH